MSKEKLDSFGDRMKEYEFRETGRTFIPGIPIYARLDGRGFSKFTKGMHRPYDVQMAVAMRNTTKYLVANTNALCGYTQSDEISLIWYSESVHGENFFNGKIQKMVSVLAGMATAKFMLTAMDFWPGQVRDLVPHFDCRVFQLPNRAEAGNAFLWREKDATKNAIQMAAHHYFSHAELQNKSGPEMQEMLMTRAQLNFNDYLAFFKRGTFIQRRKEFRKLTIDELVKIPEKHRPTGPVERTVVKEILMPSFTKVINRSAVILDGADPVIIGADGMTHIVYNGETDGHNSLYE